VFLFRYLIYGCGEKMKRFLALTITAMFLTLSASAGPLGREPLKYPEAQALAKNYLIAIQKIKNKEKLLPKEEYQFLVFVGWAKGYLEGYIARESTIDNKSKTLGECVNRMGLSNAIKEMAVSYAQKEEDPSFALELASSDARRFGALGPLIACKVEEELKKKMQ
jgi:hypothetical protein